MATQATRDSFLEDADAFDKKYLPQAVVGVKDTPQGDAFLAEADDFDKFLSASKVERGPARVATLGEREAAQGGRLTTAVGEARARYAAEGRSNVEYVAEKLPFFGTGVTIYKAHQLTESLNRLRNPRRAEEPGDLERIADFAAEVEYLEKRGVGQKILDMIAEIPGFGVEFAVTRGVGTAARKGVQKLVGKAIKGVIKKKIASTLAGGFAQVTAHTLAQPHRIAEKAVQRMTPEFGLSVDEQNELSLVIADESQDESLTEALGKGFVDHWIEVGSEYSGGLLTKIPGVSKLAAMKATIIRRYLLRGGTASGVRKLLAKSGFHGVLEESFEERVGEVARAGVGLAKLPDYLSAEFAEQLGIELASFALYGGGSTAAAHTLDLMAMKQESLDRGERTERAKQARAMGSMKLNEFMQPETAGMWAVTNPEAAADFGDLGDTPSRREWREYGFPRGVGAPARRQFQGWVGEAMETLTAGDEAAGIGEGDVGAEPGVLPELGGVEAVPETVPGEQVQPAPVEEIPPAAKKPVEREPKGPEGVAPEPIVAPKPAEPKLTPEEKETETYMQDMLGSVDAFKGAKIETNARERSAKVQLSDGRTVEIQFFNDAEIDHDAALQGVKSPLGAYVYKKQRKPGYKLREGVLHIRSNATHDTINHEAVHWMEDAGIVTAEEVAKYGGREGLAKAYAAWVVDRKEPNTLFERILEVFKRLTSAQQRFFEDVSKRPGRAAAPAVTKQAPVKTAPVEAKPSRFRTNAAILGKAEKPAPKKGEGPAFAQDKTEGDTIVEIAEANETAGYDAFIRGVSKALGAKRTLELASNLKEFWEQSTDESIAESVADIVTPSGAPAEISVKHANVELNRSVRGRPGISSVEAETFQEWVDKAQLRMEANPLWIPNLIQSLQATARGIDHIEHAGLHLFYRMTYNNFATAVADLESSRGTAAEPVAQQSADTIERQLDEIEQVARMTGTLAGRALVSRKITLNADYSLASLTLQAKRAKGGESLTADERESLSKLASRVKELEAQIVELEAKGAELTTQVQDAADAIEQDIATTPEKVEKPKGNADKIAKARSSGKRLASLLGGVAFAQRKPPTAAEKKAAAQAAARDAAQDYADAGVKHLSEFLANLSELGVDVVASRVSLKEAWSSAAHKVTPPKLKTHKDTGKPLKSSVSRLAKKIMRYVVQSGVETLDEVTRQVHEELNVALGPDNKVDRRGALDALAGYGLYRKLSVEDVDVKMRAIVGQAQQAAKLDDMIRLKEEPKKTGVQQREVERLERDLLKDVGVAKKEGGFKKPRDPQAVLKSALGTAKTVAQNLIDDLQAEIESGQKTTKRKGLVPDAELTALRKKLGQVREMHRLLFPVKQAAYMKSLKTRLAAWQKRIRDEDFGPRPKVERDYSDEMLDAQHEIAQIKARFRGMKRKWEEARYGTVRKVGMHISHLVQLSRATKTSFDLSAALRQSFFGAIIHPKTFAKAIPGMFKVWGLDLTGKKGQKAMTKQLVAINNRENAKLYGPAKLAITSTEEALLQQEEVFIGPLNKYVPGVEASERSFTYMLNQMRVEMFDMYVATLGRNGQVTLEESKLIAHFVNVLSGRGSLGSLETAAKPLLTTFFAPRFLAARLQLLTGQPIWKAYMSGNTRVGNLIALEYAKVLGSLAAIYIGFLLAAEVWPDDDEEHKPTLEFDPRSSDFGKVRFGNTRLDILGGLSQVTVVGARTITGQTVNQAGAVTPIRGEDVPYGASDTFDVMARFMRTKFSPVLSTLVNLAAGENVIGEKQTALETAKGLTAPLVFEDINDAFEEHGVKGALPLSLLAIFGVSVQTYQQGEIGMLSAEAFRLRQGKAEAKKAGKPFGEIDAYLRIERVRQGRTLIRKAAKEAGIEEEAKSYLVGLSRWGLGLPDDEDAPNPLTAKNLPKAIQDAVNEHLTTAAYTVAAPVRLTKPETKQKVESAAAYLKSVGVSKAELATLLQKKLRKPDSDGKRRGWDSVREWKRKLANRLK